MDMQKNYENMVDDHELRITTLEKTSTEFQKTLTQLENNQLRFEGILLSTSRDQKDMLRSIIEHNQKMEVRKFEAQESKGKERRDLIAKLMTAGSIIYLLIDSLAKHFIGK